MLLRFSDRFGTCYGFAELSSDMCASGSLYACICKGEINMPSKNKKLNLVCSNFTCTVTQKLNGTEAQDRSNAVWT